MAVKVRERHRLSHWPPRVVASTQAEKIPGAFWPEFHEVQHVSGAIMMLGLGTIEPDKHHIHGLRNGDDVRLWTASVCLFNFELEGFEEMHHQRGSYVPGSLSPGYARLDAPNHQVVFLEAADSDGTLRPNDNFALEFEDCTHFFLDLFDR